LFELHLRDFNPAYDGFGSNASHRHARDVPAMSASHPITTELVHHNEPTLRRIARNSHDPLLAPRKGDHDGIVEARRSSDGFDVCGLVVAVEPMHAAGVLHRIATLIWDGRFSLVTALLAGFGRAAAEVGAVLIVGGNIDGFTRVMTTAIALETSKGDLPLAIGLGLTDGSQ
jgi:hypothetical protein